MSVQPIDRVNLNASRDERALGDLPRVAALIGDYGLVSKTYGMPIRHGDPRFPITCGSLGDLATVIPNVAECTRGKGVRGGLDGAGGGVDGDRARYVSVAESLERYSSSVVDTDQLLWATPAELGDTAVSPEAFPQCSETELAHPKSIHGPVDVDCPIRWVRGWSLTRREPTWVPAVAVWLQLAQRTRGERFTAGISTGSATHTDLSAAVLNGLCEVIERDSIALTWLQKISWPELEIDWSHPKLEPFAQRHQRSFVNARFFDATTDLGVPTIYALETTEHHSELGQLVMCNTDLDPINGVAKMLRESASSRIALQSPRPVPDDVFEFTTVFHGALHMGAPHRAEAFDFLSSASPTRHLEDMPSLESGDPATDLNVVLGKLADRGHEVIVVDMTTDEARDVGFHVVKVLVPSLMPLSFVHAGRYLATPRLYQAPRDMGYPVLSEEQINPDPQPFA